jgi:hypothetical protein
VQHLKTALLLFLIAVLLIPIVSHLSGSAPRLVESHTLIPAPWLVPKQPGGTALRLAMVHDVLHERFLVHGEAWFRHRHAQVESELATYEDGSKAKDERYFALLDDQAVDCDRLGHPAEGIPILRRKLDLQQPLGADGKRPEPAREFYTTYANLGTLLAHVHLKGAIAQDPGARAGLREGLAFIEQSMQVNPDAHFGRETWQAVMLTYVLVAGAHREILTTSDVVGIDWSRIENRVFHRRSTLRDGTRRLLMEGGLERLQHAPRSENDQHLVDEIRGQMPDIGDSSALWRQFVAQPLLRRPIPFDEPTLGYIGIWTLGSGANPHFALALAHLMERVGQRGIAWNAYERTCGLAAKFWPQPDIQAALIRHCQGRQRFLEQGLGEDGDTLRRRHQAELAFGRGEQVAYQAYEAERIAAGKDPAAPDFYADFFHQRPPIASDPGTSDTVAIVAPATAVDTLLLLQAVLCSVLTLFLGGKVLSRWWQRETPA